MGKYIRVFLAGVLVFVFGFVQAEEEKKKRGD